MKKENDDVYFGRNVGFRFRMVRELKGETTKQLADFLKVKHTTVSKWESGETRMPVMTGYRILCHYGLTPEQVIFITEGTQKQYRNGDEFIDE